VRNPKVLLHRTPVAHERRLSVQIATALEDRGSLDL